MQSACLNTFVINFTRREIFTLGKTPYGDDSRYNAAFIENLVSGHRLQQPKLASNEMLAYLLFCTIN